MATLCTWSCYSGPSGCSFCQFSCADNRSRYGYPLGTQATGRGCLVVIRKFIILLAIPTLAACASTGATTSSLPPSPPSPLNNVAGLDIVMGKTAGQLQRLFGRPQQDVAEPPARKLQFASGACILDAYLYPPKSGGEMQVTHIDARRSDGAEVDRVSCVNALRRR